LGGAEGKAGREVRRVSLALDGHHGVAVPGGRGGHTGPQTATVSVILQSVRADDPAVRVETRGAHHSSTTHVVLHHSTTSNFPRHTDLI